MGVKTPKGGFGSAWRPWREAGGRSHRSGPFTTAATNHSTGRFGVGGRFTRNWLVRERLRGDGARVFRSADQGDTTDGSDHEPNESHSWDEGDSNSVELLKHRKVKLKRTEP